MPAPKPTLGYPSRTAAVVAMRNEGATTGEIATAIGISRALVAGLEHSAGRAKGLRRDPQELCRTVLFPLDVLAALRPAAAARGIHPNHLARLIVETVVDESMIDAVLDDRGEPEEPDA
jgi:hypothetical protein